MALTAVRGAVGAALMATGVALGIAANVQMMELQCEINAKLPEQEKFEPEYWTWFQYTRLRELQRAVLPASVRPKKVTRLAAIGVTLFFTGAGLLLSH